MDLRQLKYFAGVVEAGSFTKAAARLNVAQSALSLQVQQLEACFGTQLLVRDRTGVSLTVSGEKLLKRAKIILREVQLTEFEFTNKAASPAGEVTVGIPSGVARLVIGELLAVAREELPAISLKITESMMGPLQEWMDAGHFNLAVLYSTMESSAAQAVLAREEFCLVAPPDRAPFGDTIRVAELHAFPLVLPMRHNHSGRSVAEIAAANGFALNVRFEVDSLSAIVNIVAEGRGYSILPQSAIQNEAMQGQVRIVRIVDPIISQSVILSTNPRDGRSLAVTAVGKLIRRTVKRLIEAGQWPATFGDLAPTVPVNSYDAKPFHHSPAPVAAEASRVVSARV
jgi:LysR family transcriptional regulator, nitrogen assimilation regulatory protein